MGKQYPARAEIAPGAGIYSRPKQGGVNTDMTKGQRSGVPPAWIRRGISCGLCLGLAPLLALLAPLLLAAALTADLFQRRNWATGRATAFLLFFWFWEAGGILACAALWALHAVTPGKRPARFLDWNYALQRAWGLGLTRAGKFILGIRFSVEGSYPFAERRPILLFVRHAGFADAILALYLVSARHDYRLRYVLKEELLWDPCLDIAGNRLPNCFVRRGAGESAASAAAIADLCADLGTGEGVLIYPEGARFSEAKRARALAALEDKAAPERLDNLRALRHVMPPRANGPLALLEANTNADAVFCAHSGLEGAATLAGLFNGQLLDRVVHVAFWGVAHEDLPRDTEARMDWLIEQWTRVDAFVAAHARPEA